MICSLRNCSLQENSTIHGCAEVVLHSTFMPKLPMDEIHFYRSEDEYGEFSNFAPYPVTLNGKVWPTSEHYYQAQKFQDEADQEAVRQAASAMIAAHMGRSRQRALRPDWEAIRDDVMRKAVLAKFTQHPALRDLLLSTDDARIVERSDKDSYWGDGPDGQGLNRLGEILMEV